MKKPLEPNTLLNALLVLAIIVIYDRFVGESMSIWNEEPLWYLGYFGIIFCIVSAEEIKQYEEELKIYTEEKRIQENIENNLRRKK